MVQKLPRTALKLRRNVKQKVGDYKTTLTSHFDFHVFTLGLQAN